MVQQKREQVDEKQGLLEWLLFDAATGELIFEFNNVSTSRREGCSWDGKFDDERLQVCLGMFVRDKIKKRIKGQSDDPSLFGFEYGDEDDEAEQDNDVQ